MEGVAPESYRQAVVFLETPPERLERPSEARARMDQKDERFIPHLLAITTGTVVDFPNEPTTTTMRVRRTTVRR